MSRIFPFTACLWLVFTAIGCATAGGGNAPSLGSLPSDDGLQPLQTEPSVTFLLVHAEWCGPCHQLRREILAPAAAQPTLSVGSWVEVDFDTDEGQELVRAHRVLSLPSVVVLGPDGKERGRIEGYPGRQLFLKKLEALAGTAVSVDAVVEEGIASPSAARSLLKRARHSLMAGAENEGLELLEAAKKADAGNAEGIYVAAARLAGRYWIRVVGDPLRGARALRDALVQFPSHDGEAGTVYWLAKGLFDGGDASGARLELDALLSRSKNKVDAHVTIARFFQLHGIDSDRVKDEASMALTMEPNHAFAHYILALEAMAEGDREGAVRYASRAVSLQPEKALFTDLQEELVTP